jgi:hypothetical protein
LRGLRAQPWDYKAGKAAAIDAHQKVFKNESCNKNGCMEKQLDAFYGDDGSRSLNPPKKRELGDDRPELLAMHGKDA